jgi:hypothetical protein
VGLENHPALALASLEAYLSRGADVRSQIMAIFSRIQELLLALDGSENDHRGYCSDFYTARVLLEQELPCSSAVSGLSNGRRAMVKSCKPSLDILQRSLDYQPSLGADMDDLARLLEGLKSHRSATDARTWIEYAPHANLWLNTVGLALINDARERLWFLMNERCIVLSVKASQPVVHENAWFC